MNPRLLAIAATVLFSTGGAAIKVAAFSGMQVSTVRSGVAAVTLLAVTGGRIRLSWPMLAIGAVYAATVTLFVASTKLTTAANAIFLQSTAPLYIVLLGPWLLRERIRRRDLAYLTIVAVGLMLCFMGRSSATTTAPDPATGNLLALLCSIVWAATLMSLRWVERDDSGSGLSAVILGNVIASVGGLPFALPFPAAGATEWGTLVYLGTVQIGLAYVCLTRAIRKLPAFEVSLLLLLEPVLNPIWTWIVRGEEPGFWTVAGGALIVTGTAVKVMYDARRVEA